MEQFLADNLTTLVGQGSALALIIWRITSVERRLERIERLYFNGRVK